MRLNSAWEARRWPSSSPGAMFVSSAQTAERWEQVAFITGIGVVAGTVIGVGAFVAGPAVAAHGIIQSLQTVSPQELAERETDLRKAFKQVALQEQFHHFLLTSAQEKSPDRLIAIDVDPQPGPRPGIQRPSADTSRPVNSVSSVNNVKGVNTLLFPTDNSGGSFRLINRSLGARRLQFCHRSSLAELVWTWRLRILPVTTPSKRGL